MSGAGSGAAEKNLASSGIGTGGVAYMPPMARSSFNVTDQVQALRRYARSLARDEWDAEDLVQQTLMQAYSKRSLFRAGGNMRTWLFSILHNTFVSERRRSAAEQRRVSEGREFLERHSAPAQEHSVHLRQLRAAFQELPEEQRSALYLVAIEGLSYQEAAASLGVPVGTLMSRVSRARASLRELDQAGSTARPGQTAPFRIVGGSDEAER
jgi:RNA polymerase sigma-70 factor, ECF subfamily